MLEVPELPPCVRSAYLGAPAMGQRPRERPTRGGVCATSRGPSLWWGRALGGGCGVNWGAGRLEGARCAVWAVLGRGGGQVGLVRGEAG